MSENDEFWATLELLGPEKVRKNIAGHVYGEKKLTLAREWLEHKAQIQLLESDTRKEALTAEQISIARAAADAAWVAARAAESAAAAAAEQARAANTQAHAATEQARMAKIAVVISIAAMVISIIAISY